MAQGPAGTMSEGKFEGVGGLNIFFRSWRPAGRARGVVVIVHGFNSHSGQHLWVGEQLVAGGLAVYALDLRGRGKSDGERFYVEKFADYVTDVATLVTLAKSREPGLPVFLLGHSAGGVICAPVDVRSTLKGSRRGHRRCVTVGTSPFMMCRSVPQIVDVVIRTTASPGSRMRGFGFACHARRPGPP